jgi:hypothetical protein
MLSLRKETRIANSENKQASYIITCWKHKLENIVEKDV